MHQRYKLLSLALEPEFTGMVEANLSEKTCRLIFEQVGGDMSTLTA